MAANRSGTKISWYYRASHWVLHSGGGDKFVENNRAYCSPKQWALFSIVIFKILVGGGHGGDKAKFRLVGGIPPPHGKPCTMLSILFRNMCFYANKYKIIDLHVSMNLLPL